MIRKNSLICKLNNINISSKSIFLHFMNNFRPESETCPVCQSKGNCRIHGYYKRSIIELIDGHPTKERLLVMRVKCEHCQHTHAILPDILVPYASYGIRFILQVLALYFSHARTIEALCEYFSISQNLLFKWVSLFHSHKQAWLGILKDLETSDTSFCSFLMEQEMFSNFSQGFIQKFQISFLQRHQNPIPPNEKNAQSRQLVFSPDHVIF